MSEFRGALTSFRNAVRQEARDAVAPQWQYLLERDRTVRMMRFGWAAAAAAVIFLGALPIYRSAEARRIAEEQSRADAALIEQVNEGLSRSVPRAMAPLMNWTPVGGENR